MPPRKKPVIGRPPIDPDQRRSLNITFRARPKLKDGLTAAAKESERSLSEEIERRLEQSFEMPSRDYVAELERVNRSLQEKMITLLELKADLTAKESELLRNQDESNKLSRQAIAMMVYVAEREGIKIPDDLMKTAKSRLED